MGKLEPRAKRLNGYEWVGLAFFTLAGAITCFLAYRYVNIRHYQQETNTHVVQPVCCSGAVSEIGYIFEMRGAGINVFAGAPRLRWWIAVPSTGENYICNYGDGYRKFARGDGVRLIHAGADDPDVDEFIIGLHYTAKDKVAAVNCLDLSSIFTPDDW